MKIYRILGWLFFLLFCANLCYSQTDSLNQLWIEFSEDETDFLELIEELSRNPVNINSRDRKEILRIPLITNWQADSILAYHLKNGDFTSKRQIRTIVGAELYELIKEFIAIRSVETYRGQVVHKSYYSFDPAPEISSGIYHGNAFYDLNKGYYNIRPDVKAGIVTHKDPGEENYLDFYNGYLSILHKQFQVIFGSYYFQFGEGLTFSNGFGQQKSSMVSLPFRTLRNGGFPSLSSAEGTGFFGICSNAEIGKLSLNLLYSRKSRDAQMTRDYRYTIGLDPDGYHRTDTELFKKNRVHEDVYAGSIKYTPFERLTIGSLISQTSYHPGLHFSAPYVGESDIRRQYFKFNGSRLRQAAFYYDFNLNPINLRAEFSASDKGGPGFVQSIFLDRKTFNFGIKYWYLSKSFQSPFGRNFDDAGAFPQGEQGYYFSFALRPVDRLSVRAFKIVKKDLWRTYFSEMPLTRDETLLECEAVFKTIDLVARLRIKDREILPDPEDSDYISRYDSRQYITRLQLEFQPENSIRFRTRWERTTLPQIPENGTSIFEDIHYDISKSLSLRGRFVFYRTDSYNSRLYEYESDLPGSFANYAVYGEGYLWYGLIKWTLSRRISLYLKYRYNIQQNKGLSQQRILYPENNLDRTIRFQFKLLL